MVGIFHFLSFRCDAKLHHSAHTALRHRRHSRFFFRQFTDDSFGGEDQSCDGSCILQCASGDLRRIDDAGFQHIFVLVFCCIVADAVACFFDLFSYDSTFEAGIVSDLTNRSFDSMTDEVHTGLDIAFCFDGIQFILDIEQGGAAASDDTFFDSCTGRIQSIFDAQSLIPFLLR